ncbi:MAG TPA: hypothetical protein VGG91_00670, partial [Myxococcaceae bacterium]
MRSPRLSRALAASAVVHVALLGGLLALAHPRLAASPAMRVALVGTPGAAAPPPGGPGPDVPALHPSSPPVGHAPARPSPPRPVPRHPRPGDAHPDGADTSGPTEAGRVAALVTPVQSDVWMLAAPTNDGTRAAAPDGVGVAAVTGAGPPGGPDSTSASLRAPGGPSPGGATSSAPGPGASEGPASLLAALSQRLAWSAERCAPAAVVRSARRPVPGVPLHFCLDASGQPSEVGLLGTTGSEQLDRAARDCVVPGAAPLPPVPG